MQIMKVFRCIRCATVLSAPTALVPWPDAPERPGSHELLPPRLMPRTHAVDPKPFGPPYQALADAARSPYGRPPEWRSHGPRNTVVLAPGDVRNTHFLHERCDIGCYGLNGASGPNLACDGCGAEVATRIDDCGRWQEVRLDPAAVVAEEVPEADPPSTRDASEPADQTVHSLAGTHLRHISWAELYRDEPPAELGGT
jgi:hypothetical protein